MLALLSTWVLVGLFAYLNRYTHRPYFVLWTAGWLFYALWITTTISLLDAGNPVHLQWIKLAFIGICAIFLFWGSLQFYGQQRGQMEMALTVFLMVAWSFAAREHLGGTVWLSLPLFVLLSLASFLTAGCFVQRRLTHRQIGASMLGTGFGIWGVLLLLGPFLEITDTLGPTLFVLTSITQLVIAVGMIVLMLEEVRDETLRLRDQVKEDMRLARRLQKEVEISEDKYEHLFEQARDAIFTMDPRTLKILAVNRAAQALTGYSREELLQLPFPGICFCLRDKEAEIAGDPTQVQKIFSVQGNVPIQRKDKHLLLTEGAASVMSCAEGQTVQIFLREVTERRRLEQQLRQAEKLSALGQLISGVAHELNNPLAVISGYAQLLALRPALEEKTRKDLLKIQRESERASKIIQNFLTFARKHPMEKANVNLNDLVVVCLELMDYDLRASGIRVERELGADLPQVFADPNQLEQVLLNIINNAVQGMEGSPRAKVLKIRTEHADDHVKASVTDYGKGIHPSILEKIFDPFFTTKQAGVGTGLGLSISYSIVKEHSGNIYALNHPEGGAIFTLELPVSHMKTAGASEGATNGAARNAFFPHRVFKVLVVDDEAAIRDVFTEVLLEYSCRVFTAANGMQALPLLDQDEMDLIICDLKMPSMDGRRFYETLLETRAPLAERVIFVTGDTNNPRTMEFLRESGRQWFTKPFNFRDVEKLFAEHFKKIQQAEGGFRRRATDAVAQP